ncbi:cation efflux protein [Saitoella complicata NRRL Y-17804]|uniref:cation efflux protein n=1 Tax=Saitoella complicata (strain BCRC 22490 / CBS 7301 / JCM 7358 / NBRC 10748 / NRRL Y-17804) TaxID=698492 RepID=UPI0008681EE4|nr:cation efflux protein [Saitoella complicata NRRL Y-17804]ODQ55492.1 cation efflux protein [Saitoella complicata NRRL Y-17804]
MGLSRSSRIITLLVIDTAFFFLEIIVGYAVHSLALVADSFHMLNDVMSLLVALYAVKLASSTESSPKYTYGWQRAEILGALVNGVFLLALCLSIFMEAVQRFFEPQVITNPLLILVVGSAGLASNIVGLFLFHDHGHGHGGHSHGHSQGHDSSSDNGDIESVLPETVVARHSQNRAHQKGHQHRLSFSSADDIYVHPAQNRRHIHDVADERTALLNDHSEHNHAKPKDNGKGHGHSHGNLNMQGVFLHVLGDALGNVGVIATALFIWKTDFTWKYYADPVISLVITCIIFSSALPLCKSASLILLQGVPAGIDAEDVKEDIQNIKGVVSVHELHIWQLSDVKLIASVHVLVSLPNDTLSSDYMDLAAAIRQCLHSYGVHSCTVQPDIQEVTEEADRASCLLACDEDECAENMCCEPANASSPSNGHGHAH